MEEKKTDRQIDQTEWKPEYDEEKSRIANQMFFLTYKGHVDKKLYEEWWTKNWGKPTYMRLAHENGKNKGTEEAYAHTHILVKSSTLITKKGKDAMKIFDIKDQDDQVIHPHIKFLKTSTQIWAAHEKYLGKEDPENSDLKEKHTSLAAKAAKCTSRKDVLEKMVNKLSDVQGALAMYEEVKHVKIRRCTVSKLYNWQQQLYDELEKDRSEYSRKIIWYYDEVGGVGKTKFVEYMKNKRKEDMLLIRDVGRPADIAQVTKGAIDNGWSGKICVFDLTRAYETTTSFYTVMEQMHDGCMTALKYQGGEVNIPDYTHIVVFANFMPNSWKVSRDRWDIRELIKGESLSETTVNPLTLKDVDSRDAIARI